MLINATSFIVLAARDGLLGDGSREANIDFLHSIGEECSITDCECHYEEGGSKEVISCDCSTPYGQDCDLPPEEDQPW